MYERPFHGEELLNDKAFLVTGGAGFIGSNLVGYLLKYGAGKVRVLDNFSTGFRENLQSYLKRADFELTEGDIADPEVCLNACKGIDYVFHEAALGSVPRSLKDPLATHRVNVTGFLNMLLACRDAGVKKLVYASSSSVYGDSAELPKREEHIGTPLSPYAATKRVNEIYAKVFADNYGLPVVGLRYFNVFGPAQSPSGPYAAVIPLFMKAVLTGQEAVIYGDGKQTRDFTFVEDAVQANIKAAFADLLQHNGEVFNVAAGSRTSLNELFELVKSCAERPEASVHYAAPRAGDIRDSLADVSKAREAFGYTPSKSVKEGLRETLNFFRAQEKRIQTFKEHG